MEDKVEEEQGFDGFKQEFFLRKPIAIEDLIREIRKLLESG